MIDFAAVSDKGKSRKDNEDYFLTQNDIFIVADGMGGHKAGDVASKLAVQTISKFYRNAKKDANKNKLIEELFNEANRAVSGRATKISAERGMGTTLTLMLTDEQKLYFGHIGDSRAYQLRAGKLKQLTGDHSLVADMVQEGQITEEEARKHPYRNVITRALGSESVIKPDVFSMKYQNGDRYLICSDGLTTMVNDDDIESILKTEGSVKQVASRLANKANDNGGVDNITAVVVDFKEGKRKKSVKTPLLLALAAGLILASALSVFMYNQIVSNVFYIGFSEYKVAVFEGLPYKIGPFKMHEVVYKSNLSKSDLPKLWKQRIEETISVDNLSKGKKSIKEIEKESVIKKP